jgi:hypothetical protein
MTRGAASMASEAGSGASSIAWAALAAILEQLADGYRIVKIVGVSIWCI